MFVYFFFFILNIIFILKFKALLLDLDLLANYMDFLGNILLIVSSLIYFFVVILMYTSVECKFSFFTKKKQYII